MSKPSKKDLEKQVVLSIREYGISSVLFRNTIGSKLGLNVTDMECLGLLFFKGITNPTELSKYTGLSSGATTAMLDRLENAKLIRRQPNPKDRRGILIVVEESSKKTIGPLFAGTREAQDLLVASYSKRDLKLISDFMIQLTSIWEEGRKKI